MPLNLPFRSVAEKLGLMQNSMANNKIIALTGGIGSGKSMVLNIINSLGEKTLSCDVITAQLYDRQDVSTALKIAFPDCLNSDQLPDRKKIAQVVFSDKQKLKWLTDYLTPLVLDECLNRANQLGGKVFVEVPLLFECNAQNKFDGVLVITRDLDSRVKSIMERSNLTKEQVFERINSQFDYENADLSNYLLISNNGTIDELKNKITQVLNKL